MLLLFPPPDCPHCSCYCHNDPQALAESKGDTAPSLMLRPKCGHRASIPVGTAGKFQGDCSVRGGNRRETCPQALGTQPVPRLPWGKSQLPSAQANPALLHEAGEGDAFPVLTLELHVTSAACHWHHPHAQGATSCTLRLSPCDPEQRIQSGVPCPGFRPSSIKDLPLPWNPAPFSWAWRAPVNKTRTVAVFFLYNRTSITAK